MHTVHHLNYSRSMRILWLLEEIGIDYQIVQHVREPGFGAPASLRAVHASGKAPILSDKGLVIAESGVILDYIDREYAGGRFTPTALLQRLDHAQWMYFAEAGLSQPLMTTLYGRLTGGLAGVFATIIARDAGTALTRLEKRVSAPYMFGAAVTLADMQLAYDLELASYLGLLAGYPHAAAYLERLKERPALQRALAVGGPMMPPRSG